MAAPAQNFFARGARPKKTKDAASPYLSAIQLPSQVKQILEGVDHLEQKDFAVQLQTIFSSNIFLPESDAKQLWLNVATALSKDSIVWQPESASLLANLLAKNCNGRMFNTNELIRNTYLKLSEVVIGSETCAINDLVLTFNASVAANKSSNHKDVQVVPEKCICALEHKIDALSFYDSAQLCCSLAGLHQASSRSGGRGGHVAVSNLENRGRELAIRVFLHAAREDVNIEDVSSFPILLNAAIRLQIPNDVVSKLLVRLPAERLCELEFKSLSLLAHSLSKVVDRSNDKQIKTLAYSIADHANIHNFWYALPLGTMLLSFSKLQIHHTFFLENVVKKFSSLQNLEKDKSCDVQAVANSAHALALLHRKHNIDDVDKVFYTMRLWLDAKLTNTNPFEKEKSSFTCQNLVNLIGAYCTVKPNEYETFVSTLTSHFFHPVLSGQDGARPPSGSRSRGPNDGFNPKDIAMITHAFAHARYWPDKSVIMLCNIFLNQPFAGRDLTIFLNAFQLDPSLSGNKDVARVFAFVAGQQKLWPDFSVPPHRLKLISDNFISLLSAFAKFDIPVSEQLVKRVPLAIQHCASASSAVIFLNALALLKLSPKHSFAEPNLEHPLDQIISKNFDTLSQEEVASVFNSAVRLDLKLPNCFLALSKDNLRSEARVFHSLMSLSSGFLPNYFFDALLPIREFSNNGASSVSAKSGRQIMIGASLPLLLQRAYSFEIWKKLGETVDQFGADNVIRHEKDVSASGFQHDVLNALTYNVDALSEVDVGPYSVDLLINPK